MTLTVRFGLTTQGDVAIDLNDGSGRPKVTIQVGNDGFVTVKGSRGR